MVPTSSHTASLLRNSKTDLQLKRPICNECFQLSAWKARPNCTLRAEGNVKTCVQADRQSSKPVLSCSIPKPRSWQNQRCHGPVIGSDFDHLICSWGESIRAQRVQRQRPSCAPTQRAQVKALHSSRPGAEQGVTGTEITPAPASFTTG